MLRGTSKRFKVSNAFYAKWHATYKKFNVLATALKNILKLYHLYSYRRWLYDLGESR
jgi:hypothetical protein